MRDLKRYVGRKVMVQVGDDTLGGVLAEVGKDTLTLSGAALETAESIPMDGVVIVALLDVRWAQIA